MKSLFIAICVVLLSFNSLAQQPLTKQLVQQYAQSIEQVDRLVESTPEIDQQMMETMLLGKEATVKFVKSLDVFPDIERVVESVGFESFDEYYDISFRIMGGIFQHQMDNMPEGMNIDDYISNIKGQIAALESRGMSKEMIDTMKSSIASQLKSMNFMKELAENTSKADKAFVMKHYDWIEQMMPAEDHSAHAH